MPVSSYKELKEDKYFIPDDWTDKWQETLKDYTDAGNHISCHQN